jgi:hypothetical protein
MLKKLADINPTVHRESSKDIRVQQVVLSKREKYRNLSPTSEPF